MGSIDRSARADLRVELVDDAALSPGLREDWDRLAVANASPYSSPAWMLAWWRCARPPGSVFLLVVVRRGDELVGIVPFYAEHVRGPTRYRLLASTLSAHVQPLAVEGEEATVAASAAGILRSVGDDPYVVSLHGVSVRSPWPAAFGRAWAADRGSWTRWGPGMPAPSLSLEGGSYDAWLGALSRHRRAEIRRRRRRLEEAGATIAMVSDADRIRPGLQAFFALHHARWRPRGGSGVLDDAIEAMLLEAAEALVPAGRMRIWSIETDQEPVASSLFVAAGGTLSYWLGGFAEAWAQYGPSIETVRSALEDAWSRGDRVLDFGPGGQQYKFTFADHADLVHPVDLVPRTPGATRARLRLAPEHVVSRARAIRNDAVGRLGPGTQQRLKAWRKRLRRGA